MSYTKANANTSAPMLLAAVFFIPLIAAAYQAAPLATTKAPTYITEKGARLNGSYNPNEMPDNYVWFEWGIAGKDQFYQTPHQNYGGGNQPYDTYADIYGLAPNVQYYYRMVSENGRGKDVGANTYFTTKPIIAVVDPLVIVNTSDPTAITDKSALLHAYIAPHESSGVQYWFQWGTTNKLENETPHSNWGTDSGTVQVGLSGLTSGTVYFYRIVAQNGLGIVYGGTSVLTTAGTPPPPPETVKPQNVSNAQPTDGVTRNVTSSGVGASSGTTGSGPFGYDLFTFIRPKTVASTNTQTAAQQTANTPTKTTANTQSGSAGGNSSGAVANTNVAALGATNPVGSFWNNLTGKKVVEVRVEKVGPAKVPQHTPIEYRITYSYRVNKPSTNAKLKIILPASVVYIGDNTNNELLLEESPAGTERTYILPVGRLENGSTRTISILGITTGDAAGVFPDARARLEYIDNAGSSNVISSVSGAVASTASASSVSTGSDWSIIPGTFLGWVLYVLIITGAIYGIRKGKAYYQKRKEQIALEEEAQQREIKADLPGGQVPA